MTDTTDAGLVETRHRPWPMPSRPWIMGQTWVDLLFAHWPLPPAVVSPLIPPPFELETFEGDAWLGLVPFYMTDVAPRGVPALPWLSQFAELNVRTYVRAAGKPGVYFFSLDAANPVAVKAARLLFNLPYYRADMQVERVEDAIRYRSRRKGPAATAEFEASYRPAGPAFNPQPGSLEYFLTERYCLYNRSRAGRPYRLDIHHPPWTLREAEAEVRRNTMADAAGISLGDGRPLLHFSKRQVMIGWGAEALPTVRTA